MLTQQHSRRQFLKAAALAGASFAVSCGRAENEERQGAVRTADGQSVATLSAAERRLQLPRSGWASTDKFLTDYQDRQGIPSSTVAYKKFYFDDLDDPQQFASRLSAASLKSKQELMIRLMLLDSGEDMPAGAVSLKKIASRPGYTFRYDDGSFKSKELWTPDFDDPAVHAAVAAKLKALGRAFGSQQPPFVDIGVLGLWGEWHFGDTKLVNDPRRGVPMPSIDGAKRIIDLHREAFPHSILLAQLQDDDNRAGGAPAEFLKYAVSQGAGIRADCLGAPGSPMMTRYGRTLEKAGAAEQWKRAPVAFEICGNLGSWLKRGWDAGEILERALEYHVSIINTKTAVIPEKYAKAFEQFFTRCGAQLELASARWPAPQRPGAQIPIDLVIRNGGVAPPYFDLYPTVQLRAANGEVVQRAAHAQSLKNALPGEHRAQFSLAAVPVGSYTLEAGVSGDAPQVNQLRKVGTIEVKV